VPRWLSFGDPAPCVGGLARCSVCLQAKSFHHGASTKLPNITKMGKAGEAGSCVPGESLAQLVVGFVHFRCTLVMPPPFYVGWGRIPEPYLILFTLLLLYLATRRL
jgi:hypothetical protein